MTVLKRRKSDGTDELIVGNNIGLNYSPVAYSGATDDVKIQAAMMAASTAGGGTVDLRGRAWALANPLVPKSNITLLADESAPITTTYNGSAIASGASGFNDFVVDSLTFVGPVSNTVTVPTRARTTSGNGINVAINIDGSLDTSGSFPVITNVTIKNCHFKNCYNAGLPTIRIFGVTGKVIHTGNDYFNCMDAGFGFNEEVINVGNHSKMSQDNGFSLSRGNNKVTCVANTVQNAAFDGIWLSGSGTDKGPQDFVCVGNVVKNTGNSGIILQDAPKYGLVAGNTIDQGYNRGPVDSLTDINCSGIFVRGYPSGSPDSPTDYATGLSITGNVIRNAARSGIYVAGLHGADIANNLILDCGTQFYSDGTTAIGTNLSSQTNPQDMGIFVDRSTTCSDVYIRNNTILDQRATPYCVQAIYPALPIAGVTAYGNVQNGCRLATTLPALIRQDTLNLSSAGEENIPRWASTSLTGITMANGTCRFAYFRAKANRSVTQIKVESGNTAAGATPTLVRYGLYSVDSSGNLTLMSAITSDTSIFASTQTDYARNLAAGQNLIEGQPYAVGIIVMTSQTAPTVMGAVAGTPAHNADDPRLCATLTGQTDLPSTVTAGSLATTQSIPYVQVL